MTSKTRSTRGKIVIERTVYTSLHKICIKTGWTAKKISPGDSEISDQLISAKYGKGVNILLTTDKTFFKNNTDNGFIGYVVQELPEKKDIHKFEQQMEHILSTNTSKSLRGYQTIVGVDTVKKEKVK